MTMCFQKKMIIVGHVLPLFVPAVVSSFKADFAQMDFKTAIANPECKHCHSDTKDSNLVNVQKIFDVLERVYVHCGLGGPWP